MDETLNEPIELVIGYDARTVSSAWESLWTKARRDQYLIRDDVAMPFSVDNLVWPSVFDWGQGIGLSQEERHHLLLDGLPVSDGNENQWPLWTDASRMSASLSRPPRPEFLPYWWVAISRADHGEVKTGDMRMIFLGYDVADDSLLSGVTNCGYEEEERGSLRAAWSGKLNEYHLFPIWEDADRFCQLSDVRVSEHAPFRIYAIWRNLL